MRRYLLIGCLLGLLLLCGCAENTGLGDVTIVRAIGVDRDEDGYTLTLQLYSPPDAGNESTAPVVVQASGKEIAALPELCTLHHGRTLFLGKCELIAFSEALLREGADEVLDWIYREQINVQAACTAVRGRAEDLLQADLPEAATGKNPLAAAIENAVAHGQTVFVRLIDTVVAMANGQGSVAMPYLSLQEKTPHLTVCVLRDRRLVTLFTKRESEALCCLLSDGTRTMTIEPEGGTPINLRVQRLMLQITPSVYQGTLYIRVAAEYKTDGKSAEPIKLCEQQLRLDIEYMLHKLCIRNGVDLFHLTERLRWTEPDSTITLQDMLQNSRISVSIVCGR